MRHTLFRLVLVLSPFALMAVFYLLLRWRQQQLRSEPRPDRAQAGPRL